MPAQNDSEVLCFRVDSLAATKLEDAVSNKPVTGIKSRNQMARKIVLDFLDGRLVYLNSKHEEANLALG